MVLLLIGCASVMAAAFLGGLRHQRAADEMAEQDRKPPARRSRQLRPGHDRCGRCLFHGAPPPNGPNRATLLDQVGVALSPKVAVQTVLREWMENHIKSWKRHLAADRTSCTKAAANQFRLFLHAGAYWLLWSLRTLMPRRSSWRTAQFDTLRLRLVKLAVRVVEMKTQVKLHLPSHAPCQSILAFVLGRMPRIVS